MERFLWVDNFNPLPHAEGDIVEWYVDEGVSDFNPLPHAEGDFDVFWNNLDKILISIHSLTQRETRMARSERGVAYFNPLPHAEGDTTTTNELLDENDFNPLPHAEGDTIS